MEENPQPPAQQTVIVNQQSTNGLGTAGFVTSLVSIITCGILSPIALLLSVIALFKRPRGMAIAGVTISGIQLAAVLMIGIAPILGVIGLSVGLQKKQQAAYEENRVEVLETLASGDEMAVRQISLDYTLVNDQEFRDALEAAKERTGGFDSLPEEPVAE